MPAHEVLGRFGISIGNGFDHGPMLTDGVSGVTDQTLGCDHLIAVADDIVGLENALEEFLGPDVEQKFMETPVFPRIGTNVIDILVPGELLEKSRPAGRFPYR